MAEVGYRSILEFSCYSLRNDALSIEVVPELGAKISSLVNRQTGREWMWAPPEYSGTLFRNRTGDRFDDSTKTGADECIPTIAPCEWKGRLLPDHGEAWAEEWTLDEAALDDRRIVTSLRLPISPLHIKRSISLEGNSALLDYRVTNLADEPSEYIWALHPLMNIQEGDRILLPDYEHQAVITDSAYGLPWEGRGHELCWPKPASGIEFDRLKLSDKAGSVKLYTMRSAVDQAEIRNERSGEYLSLHFDPTVLSTLGIWINCGAWNGYHHVALEPATGAPDPLDFAVTGWEHFKRLAPGASQEWRLEIRVGGGE